MIGYFLLNSDQDICFIDVERRGGISAFRYIPEMKIVMVIFSDGADEPFTEEIGEPFHKPLSYKSKILVVQVDEEDPSKAVFEEFVPLATQ